MIRLNIMKTAKSLNPRDTFTRYANEDKYFGSIKGAKEWLRDEYGKCKKQRMYTETKDGDYHTGWIYCFKNEWDRCYEQHWVGFYETNPVKFHKLGD